MTVCVVMVNDQSASLVAQGAFTVLRPAQFVVLFLFQPISA